MRVLLPDCMLQASYQEDRSSQEASSPLGSTPQGVKEALLVSMATSTTRNPTLQHLRYKPGDDGKWYENSAHITFSSIKSDELKIK